MYEWHWIRSIHRYDMEENHSSLWRRHSKTTKNYWVNMGRWERAKLSNNKRTDDGKLDYFGCELIQSALVDDFLPRLFGYWLRFYLKKWFKRILSACTRTWLSVLAESIYIFIAEHNGRWWIFSHWIYYLSMFANKNEWRAIYFFLHIREMRNRYKRNDDFII